MVEISFGSLRLVTLLVVLLTSLASGLAAAQVATGSIVGTVTDSSGQVVPGAQVTIREVNRNTTTTLVTDASGVYTAPFLVREGPPYFNDDRRQPEHAVCAEGEFLTCTIRGEP